MDRHDGTSPDDRPRRCGSSLWMDDLCMPIMDGFVGIHDRVRDRHE
jgi:hypothetical protein